MLDKGWTSKVGGAAGWHWVAGWDWERASGKPEEAKEGGE